MTVTLSFLMTISTFYSCVLEILGSLSVFTKVRTLFVACADIGRADQFFVLYNNCLPIFTIQS